MSFSCKNLHLIRTKGTKSSCGVSAVLCPFVGQAIQGSWILVLLLFWFSLTGPSTSPEDIHVYMCGFTLFHLLPEWHCLGWLLKNSLALWSVALHLGTFSSADDYWPLGRNLARWWVQSLTHVESTKVTLTNWGYFIIEVYEGDTVTLFPSLPWKPNSDNKDFILITGHYTTSTNTLHFVGQVTISFDAQHHSRVPCRCIT